MTPTIQVQSKNCDSLKETIPSGFGGYVEMLAKYYCTQNLATVIFVTCPFITESQNYIVEAM